MRDVAPSVHVVARPQVDFDGMRDFLDTVDAATPDGLGGAYRWVERPLPQSDGEVLIEFAGRNCYRSWDVGLNANVSRVREDSGEYLENILKSGHGSVLEHSQYTFALANVSRVFTHELVRHRVGVGISQESLRFVRLTDIPVWMPEWAANDPELAVKTAGLVEHMEDLQVWMAEHFGLDNAGVPFSEKKHKTSFMRRFAPEGVATSIVWSANIRTLRWVLQARTDFGAEEEIRLVFHMIGEAMVKQAPHLFGDFEQVYDWTISAIPAWVPNNRKV